MEGGGFGCGYKDWEGTWWLSHSPGALDAWDGSGGEGGRTVCMCLLLPARAPYMKDERDGTGAEGAWEDACVMGWNDGRTFIGLVVQR